MLESVLNLTYVYPTTKLLKTKPLPKFEVNIYLSYHLFDSRMDSNVSGIFSLGQDLGTLF